MLFQDRRRLEKDRVDIEFYERFFELIQMENCNTKVNEDRGLTITFDCVLNHQKKRVYTENYSTMSAVEFIVDEQNISWQEFFRKVVKYGTFDDQKKMEGLLSTRDSSIKAINFFKMKIEEKLYEKAKALVGGESSIENVKMLVDEKDERLIKFDFAIEDTQIENLSFVPKKYKEFTAINGFASGKYSVNQLFDHYMNIDYPVVNMNNKLKFLTHLLVELVLDEYKQTDEYKLKKVFGTQEHF